MRTSWIERINWLPLLVSFSGSMMSKAILSLGFSRMSGMRAFSLGLILVNLLVCQIL